MDIQFVRESLNRSGCRSIDFFFFFFFFFFVQLSICFFLSYFFTFFSPFLYSFKMTPNFISGHNRIYVFETTLTIHQNILSVKQNDWRFIKNNIYIILLGIQCHYTVPSVYNFAYSIPIRFYGISQQGDISV
jgi:hypothetical protein